MQKDITKKLQDILEATKDNEIKLYQKYLLRLKEKVDQKLLKRSDLNILIGSNNKDIMTTNHLNHAYFISSILVIKSAITFVNTIIWAYKSYMARGFTHRYFYYELQAWLESIKEFDLEMPNIKKLYRFLIKKHNVFISLSIIDVGVVVDKEFETLFNQFVRAILTPDINKAINISNTYISSPNKVRLFWQGVILPALYEVGRQWSENIITVGQEHLATSICQRVMAVHYPKILHNVHYSSKSVLIACSPHELHEVGAIMLSDFLELEGINSLFIGANSSNKSIIKKIKIESPMAIAISTTIVGNILELKKLIQEIREDRETAEIKIVVGGQSFLSDPSLLEKLDYDFYSNDISKVTSYLKSLS